MNRGKRLLAWMLFFLMCLPVVSFGEQTPTEETDPYASTTGEIAENVSKQCTFESDMKNFYSEYLLDGDLNSKRTIFPSYPLKIDLEDSGAMFLCIAWLDAEQERVIRFYGANDVLVSEITELYPYHDETIAIPEGTSHLEIAAAGEEEILISEIQLYGAGELPEPWSYVWEPTPEKLDFLIISTHFDDDVLFLGAVMPIYGVEHGYTGTILYMTYQLRQRLDEALQGVWTMGERCYPLFAMLPDIYKQESKRAPEFSKKIVTNYIVRYFRQYKPLVIFTQDTKGEYGHWQHVRVVECVLEAATLAADESYDPESVATYGTWQVQKVYCHLYPENKLMLDTRAPLEAFGGLNAFEIATEAYKKHVSQHQYWFYVSDDNKYSIGDYGLAFSAVENPGEDAFDGIDETLLVGYVPPTPTPSPEPTPTPTPAPTATPTQTPQTTSPVPVVEETTAKGITSETRLGILVGLGLLLIALFAYVLFNVSKRKKQDKSLS